MFDYSIFYKEEKTNDISWADFLPGDRFISAYNESYRVQEVYNNSPAKTKHWLVFPEYNYSQDELPNDNALHLCSGDSESEQIGGFFEKFSIDFEKEKIVVDITGFIRPQLAYLINYLFRKKVKRIELIYSEPKHYRKKENTSFSGGSVKYIRQIQGFEGAHSSETDKDVLIIGSGYDQNLIKSICNHKENAKKIQILGFPSLRPDMYQENILRTVMASEELSEEALIKTVLATASDPFITASVLSETVNNLRNTTGISNLYLSPLATKPQVVGFVLFYLRELVGESASMVFPFYSSYDKETSTGINKVWKYIIEF